MADLLHQLSFEDAHPELKEMMDAYKELEEVYLQSLIAMGYISESQVLVTNTSEQFDTISNSMPTNTFDLKGLAYASR